MSINYRPSIDGLRAIAVIPVILFHADVSAFSGGYVGVDIFFVISGYLITRILLNGIRQNNFSILAFYNRRIRRIFPALFTVLLVSSCVALGMLLPSELETYGESLLAATLFFSNYYFMFDTGYFAAPAETKPLLHIWSLAVEEQFYIVFPMYLFIVTRFLKSKHGIITALILFVSLSYSINSTNTHTGFAFYSTPSRAWEFLVGSILAILPECSSKYQRLNNVLSTTGLGAIVFSILFYSSKTPFPGEMALLPVIGAALIIYTGNTNYNFVGAILARKELQTIGLMSYSLYLWHWPVLVFYEKYFIRPMSSLDTLLAIGITVVLSYLSWKLIETPFRNPLLFSNKRILTTGASAILVGGIVSISFIFGNKVLTSPHDNLEKIYATATVEAKALIAFKNEERKAKTNILSAKEDKERLTDCEQVRIQKGQSLKICLIGAAKKGSPTFAVWGDSHGKAILPGIQIAAKQNDKKGIFVGKAGCLTLLGAHQVRDNFERCVDIADNFMLYLSDHPEIKIVILSSRWALYAMGVSYKSEKGHNIFIKDKYTESLSLEENIRTYSRSMARTLMKLKSLGRQVYFVEQVPETEWNIPDLLVRTWGTQHTIEFRPKIDDYLDRNKFVTDVFNKNKSIYSFDLLQPHKIMCMEKYCNIYDNDFPIYRDTNHLTKTYAERLSKLFDPIFKQEKAMK